MVRAEMPCDTEHVDTWFWNNSSFAIWAMLDISLGVLEVFAIEKQRAQTWLRKYWFEDDPNLHDKMCCAESYEIT